jgi:hypothetical protein
MTNALRWRYGYDWRAPQTVWKNLHGNERTARRLARGCRQQHHLSMMMQLQAGDAEWSSPAATEER